MAISQTLINLVNNETYAEFERLRQLSSPDIDTYESGQEWRQFVVALTSIFGEVVSTGSAGQIANANIALTWIGELRSRLAPWTIIDNAFADIFSLPLFCPESGDIATAILEITAIPTEHPSNF